jgi:hypothetical protein
MRRFAGTMFAVLVVLAAANAWARETVTIINYENRPARANRAPLTGERVKQAIMTAIQKSKWTVTEDTPGRLLTSQSWNNKHTMVVEIRYNDSSYSVLYNGSTNLNYFRYGKNGPEIHPAYNQRVKLLLDAIDAELRNA